MSEPSRTLSSTKEAALTGYDPDRTSYCSSCGRVTFYWERYEDAGTAVDRGAHTGYRATPGTIGFDLWRRRCRFRGSRTGLRTSHGTRVG